MISFATCYLALLLSSSAFAAPAASSAASSAVVASSVVPSATSSAAVATATVPYISLNPNYPLWGASGETSEEEAPSAQRGTLGASVIGPTDSSIVLQNPDLLAPPTTDGGSV